MLDGERGHWSDEKLESNIAFYWAHFFLLRRCNNIPIQTWIMCAICDNTVSSFLNAWKYYHNTENVFLRLQCCWRFEGNRSEREKSSLPFCRRSNHARGVKITVDNFVFALRKEEEKRKRAESEFMMQASINNVNASEKKKKISVALGQRSQIGIFSRWNALNS